ncbi:MAG: SDR family NAD(P)-dependent oxidoreductase, partial [Burkholderiaceae bacterium]
WGQIQAGVGQLWARGVAIDWGGYEAGRARKRVPTPTYPFQRKRFWVEPVYAHNVGSLSISSSTNAAPLLGQELTSSALEAGQHLFEQRISAQSPAFLSEHLVFGQVVVPATFFHEMALEAYARQFDGLGVLLNIVIQQPLILHGDTQSTLQCLLTPSPAGYRYKISSYTVEQNSASSSWVVHVTGELGSTEPLPVLQKKFPERSLRPISAGEIYEAYAGQGLQLGQIFQTLRTFGAQDLDFEGEVAFADNVGGGVTAGSAQWHAHPALLDGVGQAFGCALKVHDDRLFLPVGIDKLVVLQKGLQQARLQGRIHESGEGDSVIRSADIDVLDTDGRPAVQIRGLALRAVSADALAQVGRSNVNRHALHQLTWVPVPLPDAHQEIQSQSWLVIGHQDALAAQVCDALRHAGQAVEMVDTGDLNSVPTDSDSRVKQSIAAAFTILTTNAQSPYGGMILLSPAQFATDKENSSAHLAQKVTHQGAIWLAAMQASTDAPLSNDGGRPRFLCVTRGSQEPGDHLRDGDFAGAALGGLMATAALEHVETDWVHIDLGAERAAEPAKEARQVVAEAITASPESRLTFQEGQRFAGRIESMAEFEPVPTKVDSQATYLVTGGFGGVGLTVLGWLAARGARHLMVLGRSAPKPDALDTIKRLEAQGVVIERVTADIGDVDQTIASLSACLAKSGRPLKGVVHLAGVLQDGLLASMTKDDLNVVLRPKLTGTLNLHRATLEQPLEFFLMSSSAAAAIGSAGQGNYAAANSCLGAIARYRQNLGLPATAIAFGPWNSLGMTAAMDAAATRRMSALGWNPIRGETADSLWDDLTLLEAPEAAVLPVEWPVFVRQFANGRVPALFAALDLASDEDPHTDFSHAAQDDILSRVNQAAPDEQAKIVNEFLAMQIRQVVGLEKSQLLTSEHAFGELGMDSLMHMELRNAVNSPLGINLAVGEFVQCPTIGALTELILNRLAAASLSAIGSDADFDDSADVDEIVI